jgi:hypothetical protein
MVWTVSDSGTSGGLLWTRWWTFGFHKMMGSSWVAAQLAASQEGLSSVSMYDIVTCRGDYTRCFGLDDWNYRHLIRSQLGTTGNTALSLIYTLHSSPLHTHQGSQSSLVVSWQRIYNSLTVISDHTWSLLFTAWFPSCYYSATANSIQFLCSQAHILAGWRLNSTLIYKHVARTTQKTHPAIVRKACLQRRCIATDVTRLLLLPLM